MKGFVSKIIKMTGFGIITGEDGQQYLFNRNNCKKSCGRLINSDEVIFDVLESNGSLIATNISLTDDENEDFKLLQFKFDSGQICKGYLKKINNKYFIKDADTYIFISVRPGKYEINIAKNYELRLNDLVDYKITFLNENKKVFGALVDREFMPECYKLKQGELDAEIIGKNKGGYLVMVFKKIEGFIPNNLVEKHGNDLKVGDNVKVKLINCNSTFESCVFDII